MNNGILIIAHAPLASALRQCVLHVFPDAEAAVATFDVQPNTPPEETLAGARQALALLNVPQTLVLADVFGATPCNVAHRLVDGVNSKFVAGVYLPRCLRRRTHRGGCRAAVVARALAGGAQGVMPVATTAPLNQLR